MKLTIEIPDDDAALITRTLAAMKSNKAHDSPLGTGGDHGKLDITALAQMLMEDVVLAIRRPGSWEGINMYEVLRCHGYTDFG